MLFGNMKNFTFRAGFFVLVFILLVTAQPVQAEDGVLGIPPSLPDPSQPSLQYAGCGGQIPAVYNLDFEQQVINLVNQERTNRGLVPLQLSQGLTYAARYQAADMSQDNYFSHDTMDRVCGTLVLKCGPWERIANYYSGAIGENAAAGYHSPEAVVQAWMNSTGHRNNILNPDTRSIGVGFYQGSGDFHSYWVQDFGTEIDTSAAATQMQLSKSLTTSLSSYAHKVYLPNLTRSVTNSCQQ